MKISAAKLKQLAREKAISFLHFAHNKEKGEFFGKTCKGWGQTLGFFFIFYSFLAALFAVHLAVFLLVTPQPGRDSEPSNFGRYAYPNYPNAKIGLLSVPGSFSYDGERATLSSSKLRDLRELINSANSSGVFSHCLDEHTNYGYDIGQPCIFLRVMKVFEWSPEMISESLSSFSFLPLSCLPSSISGLNVELSSQPNGLPLNLSNHVFPTPRSYPFRGKGSNYISPIMGLLVNLTAMSVPSGESRFSIKITCSVNLTAIGLEDLPASLSRLYEIPSSATTTISVRL